MSMTKTVYDLPLPDISAIEDLSDIAEYIDTLAAFVADKMNLVVREDLTVTSPDYAPYSYVKFLAPSANADPYFCVYNANSSTLAIQCSLYTISPVGYSGGAWRVPKNVFTSSSARNNCAVERWANEYGAILITDNQTNNKITLEVFDFSDGRIVGCFKSYVKSSGVITNYSQSASLYIGPIKIFDDTITTGLVFAYGVNGPYITDYEQEPYPSVFSSSMPSLSASNWFNNAGIYIPNKGKECIIELDYHIGTDASVHGYLFSNSANAEAGRVVTIENKRYLILWTNTGYNNFVLLIPEEVN